MIGSPVTIATTSLTVMVNPVARLIDVKGKLYGTTLTGGFNELYGTVFRAARAATRRYCILRWLRPKRRRESYCRLVEPEGHIIWDNRVHGAGLSSAGYGTAYAISPSGTEHVMRRFAPCSPDGDYPGGRLDQRQRRVVRDHGRRRRLWKWFRGWGAAFKIRRVAT